MICDRSYYLKIYFLNDNIHLGQAVGVNPGYLKLRKIRAAQSIARTVSTFILCKLPI